MKTQNTFKKFFLLTIVSGVVALAPQLSKAAEVQTITEGDIGSSSKEDSYLKSLVDTLKTVESAPQYQKALTDLKNSTSECTALKEWTYSKPDLSGNLVVKKTIEEGNPGTSQGPAYTIMLSYPDVRKDSFNSPIEIFSNSSFLSEISLATLYKQTLEKVASTARTNRLLCSRLATENKEENTKTVSSN